MNDPADILARTILGEAAGEGALGQQAVAATIMNRVRDPRWPNDPVQVALQPQQFSAWNSGAGGNDLVNRTTGDPGYDAAYQVANQALSGGLEDPTKGATHYYSPMGMSALVDEGAQANTVPTWYDDVAAQGAPRTIGNHVFLGAVDGSIPYAAAAGAADASPEAVFSNAGADVLGASPAAQIAASSGPSGFAIPDDGRSGAGRVYDWMGDQGMLSSLLTGAGLLIGGREALPLLGDFGGQYDQFAQQEKMQRDLEQAMSTLSGQLDPRSLSIVQALAQAGQPEKAMEYAMKAVQGSDAEYAYEKQGDGTLVAINKRNPSDIRKIGGPKPADGASDGLPGAVKEARFVAEGEGLAAGTPEFNARVGELVRGWRAGSDSGYSIVENRDGTRSYVPKQPGLPAVPVQGLPKPPAEVPDPTTSQQEVHQIAVQRAIEAGHRPGTVEAAQFVKAEEARILATKYADPNASTPDQMIAREERFLNRFNKDPVVSGYAEMDAAYGALETAANLAAQGNTVAAQAAVVSFVKSLDPTSVVRDSETGAIVRSAGLGEAIWSRINYILGEGQVSPQMLQNMVETVRASMAAGYPKAMERFGEVSRQAEGYNLDPNRFMTPPRRYDWMPQYNAEVRGPDPFPRADLNRLPIEDLDDIARRQAAEALRNLGAPQADQMGPLK